MCGSDASERELVKFDVLSTIEIIKIISVCITYHLCIYSSSDYQHLHVAFVLNEKCGLRMQMFHHHTDTTAGRTPFRRAAHRRSCLCLSHHLGGKLALSAARRRRKRREGFVDTARRERLHRAGSAAVTLSNQHLQRLEPAGGSLLALVRAGTARQLVWPTRHRARIHHVRDKRSTTESIRAGVANLRQSGGGSHPSASLPSDVKLERSVTGWSRAQERGGYQAGPRSGRN